MSELKRSRAEHWHSRTHGVAFLLTALGIPVMMLRAIESGDPWHIVGCAIFGATMVATFAASALYHGAVRPGRKRLLRIVDHSSIYLLIAGSYTPFCLTGLRSSVGWWMLGVAWSLALFGVIFKLFFTGRFERFSTALYLFMGWMATIAIGPMLEVLLPGTMALLIFAGISFSIGTIFYYFDCRGFHLIWHLLVMVGCACLWGAVFHELPVPV